MFYSEVGFAPVKPSLQTPSLRYQPGHHPFRTQFRPPHCPLATLQGLGYCILLGSTVVKVPQLINVVRARSAAGLSSLSVELETLGYAISASYGLLKQLPFSAYGETMVRIDSRSMGMPCVLADELTDGTDELAVSMVSPRAPPTLQTHTLAHFASPISTLDTPCHFPPQAMLLQNALLLVLIYHYQRKSAARTLCLLLALAGWAAALTAGALPFDKVALALSFNNLLFMASRVPQIVQSAQAGSTGQLSSITYTLNVAGAGARIFTSIHEKAGPAMLQGAILGGSSGDFGFWLG